eukprot:1947375-Pyramimonas_sp.AAC.1
MAAALRNTIKFFCGFQTNGLHVGADAHYEEKPTMNARGELSSSAHAGASYLGAEIHQLSTDLPAEPPL